MADASDKKPVTTSSGVTINVPAPPEAKGGITTEGGAGKAEATLLMAGESHQAAALIAKRALAALRRAEPGRPIEIIVIAGEPSLETGLLDQFDLACDQLEHQLQQALGVTPAAGGLIAQTTSLSVPVIGAALNTIGGLLSGAATAAQYFVIKRKQAGIELTPDDALLVLDVAHHLLNEDEVKVQLAPISGGEARKAIFARMQDLGGLALTAANKAAEHERSAARLAAQATADTDAARKTDHERQAHEEAAAALPLRAAAKAFDDFGLRFAKKPEEGGLPIADIIGQQALRDRLDSGAAALFVRVAAAGGGLATREGLFIGLGDTPPCSVFAMIVASYALFDGGTRELRAAGNLRSPSPYVDLCEIPDVADDVEERIDNYGLRGGRQPRA